MCVRGRTIAPRRIDGHRAASLLGEVSEAVVLEQHVGSRVHTHDKIQVAVSIDVGQYELRDLERTAVGDGRKPVGRILHEATKARETLVDVHRSAWRAGISADDDIEHAAKGSNTHGQRGVGWGWCRCRWGRKWCSWN